MADTINTDERISIQRQLIKDDLKRLTDRIREQCADLNRESNVLLNRVDTSLKMALSGSKDGALFTGWVKSKTRDLYEYISEFETLTDKLVLLNSVSGRNK